MKIKYSLSEIKPNIWLVNCPDRYDLAMLFLRYQEYYESPSPKFRGKCFNILEFMKWYSSEYGNGIFTYPNDWAGFNIPSYVIEQISNHFYDGIDWNFYDAEMTRIYGKCSNKSNKFYLIGASSINQDQILKHEIAHGFFYLNPEYKKEMTQLVKNLDPSTYKKICDWLQKVGYSSKVFVDECQAYLATGIPKWSFKVANERKPFVKLYDKYYLES